MNLNEKLVESMGLVDFSDMKVPSIIFDNFGLLGLNGGVEC